MAFNDNFCFLKLKICVYSGYLWYSINLKSPKRLCFLVLTSSKALNVDFSPNWLLIKKDVMTIIHVALPVFNILHLLWLRKAVNVHKAHSFWLNVSCILSEETPYLVNTTRSALTSLNIGSFFVLCLSPQLLKSHVQNISDKICSLEAHSPLLLY